MSFVIPPVVLVHGIWGNRASLQFYENSLETYNPWKVYLSASGINRGIRSIKYTNNIAFDSLDAMGGPNTLKKTITGATWARLDTLHFVGGRVDVVAHSMGGLVARALAGQELQELKDYPASRRDRRQGSIHQIITLDTPEKGSALATFLLDNKDATYQNMDGFPIGTLVRTVWTRACGKAPGMTIKKCFNDKLKLNISGGGVASLDPENPCLKIIPGKPCLTNVAGPAEPKWIWNAIGAVVPQTRGRGENVLQFVLENLIAAIYPHTSEAPTISLILNDNGQDDAIVPLSSQIPQGAAQSHTFPGLAHTGLSPSLQTKLGSLLTGLSFDSVVELQGIADLISRWLICNGAASCNQQPAAAVQAKAQGPVPTPKPRMAPVNATANNAPMTVQMPQNVQLAIPFEIAITKSGTALAELAVTQQDEMGHHTEGEKPAVSRVASNTAYVKVIPMLLGSVTFTVEAVFKDGSVSSQDVKVPVGVPSVAPKLFHGDQFPEFSLSLQKGGDVAPLQPEAYYATIPDEIDKWGHAHPVAVDLTGRVDYRIVPSGVAPVVRLESDSHGSVIGVRALRPGTATIEARFGTAVDQIVVTVEPHH